MDNEENFLSILSEQSLENLLTKQEAATIQTKLWDILAGRVDSYQRGGSSSVRAETAQELLKSAGFVLRHGIDTLTGRQGAAPETIKARLISDDYDTLFKNGLKAIEAQVKIGEVLLEKAIKTAVPVDNTAYRDTLLELGIFFKRYHYHHFAHEIPCMLDYPLAHPVDEALMGIDYINEYLRRLLIENDFTGRFNPETVTLLLKSFVPDFKENLLSFYEVTAANALALTLLGGDITGLDVTDDDRRRLLFLIGARPDGIVQKKLLAAASGLCAILGIGDEASQKYLALTAQELSVRLMPLLAVGRLEHLLPSLYRQMAEKKPAVTYIDGALMDDEKLRLLIDALTSCRILSDKITMARRHITSLRDWAEVLGICFWGEELKELFSSFGPDEIGLLMRYVREKQRKYPDWVSETGWEAALIAFTKETD